MGNVKQPSELKRLAANGKQRASQVNSALLHYLMEDTEVNDNNEYLPFIKFLLFCLYEFLMRF